METVDIRLESRSYSIQIGAGGLTKIDVIRPLVQQRDHVVIITDDVVAPLFSMSLADALRTLGPRVDVLTTAAGEASKCVTEAERFWNKLMDLAADRQTLIAALGGGVVGDLAGFVAAGYARGLDWLQFPTTLLAQVDSSVGGKVGVNLPKAKNMVGAFWQPKGVVIDLDVLTSLPDREYRSGLAEVVKYGVILDEPFFAYLEQHVAKINERDPAVLQHVIARCCRLKADVVERDERETLGLRAVLNYGHTFAHAFEAETHYGEYLHGEAVSMGMCCAARLARLLGRVRDEFVQRQQHLLEALHLPVQPPRLPASRLLAAMRRDKKTSAGKLRFILPVRLGLVETVRDVDDHFIRVACE